jgi:hypothetical protein
MLRHQERDPALIPHVQDLFFCGRREERKMEIQKTDEEMLYKRLKYYQSQLTDLEKNEKEEEHNAGDELQ